LGVADYQAPNLTAPDVAPLLAPSHRGLPSAYLQICGLDPLRDEAFLYEKFLRENGVPTKFDVCPGQPHGFASVDPRKPGSRKWRVDVQEGVRWLSEMRKL
jgi:acetyl esterase/lipase